MTNWLKAVGAVLLLGLFVGACGSRRPSGPPPLHRHMENLTVMGVSDATPITATLHIDDGTSYIGVRDEAVAGLGRFSFLIQSPPTQLGWGGHLTVTADGYRAMRDLRVVIGHGDHELPAVTLERVRRFPAEQAPIRVCGQSFCDAAGGIWDWRGASMFTLPARFIAGEDITPQIRWMHDAGVNVARVFVNWEVDWLTAPNRPFEHPDYDAKLGAFFDRMALEGLRVEATVITENGRSAAYWRPILQRVFDLASTRWNIFVEATNEPWVRDIDPVEVMRGVDRHGVLSAYGTMPPAIGEAFQSIPVLDYVTPHLPRDAHFPHNSKDALGIRDVLRVPVVLDEPMGIGPPRPRGGRTQDAAAVWSHFAIGRLFAAGCTMHTQAGIDGLTPVQAGDTLTQAIVEGIGAIWTFVPGRTYTGVYTRAGLSTFSLRYRDGDSTVNHAYASVHEPQQWAVIPMPKPGWRAEAAAGWLIEAVGPAPYILRLARR